MGELNQKIDILIPVKDGLEFLPKLLSSLEEYTKYSPNYSPKYSPQNIRCIGSIIVADDASTDRHIKPFLENWFEKHHYDPEIKLIYHTKNVGFVETVNEMASINKDNDFVILNQDTAITHQNWLNNMAACLQDDVAGVMPWSNSTSISSFPYPFMENNVNYTLHHMGRIFNLFDKLPVEVPTLTGFCMLVNRKWWGDGFDIIFSPGYEEENDWCQRVRANGAKLILCPTVFVYHVGGGSFKRLESTRLKIAHAEIMRQRWPNYLKEIFKWIHDDPLKEYRQKLLKMLNSTPEVN